MFVWCYNTFSIATLYIVTPIGALIGLPILVLVFTVHIILVLVLLLALWYLKTDSVFYEKCVATCCDKYVLVQLYQTVYLLCRYYCTIFVMSDRLEMVYNCFHANSVNFVYTVFMKFLKMNFPLRLYSSLCCMRLIGEPGALGLQMNLDYITFEL